MSLRDAKGAIHKYIKSAARTFITTIGSQIDVSEEAVQHYKISRDIDEVFKKVAKDVDWICPEHVSGHIKLEVGMVGKIAARYAASERFFFPYIVGHLMKEFRKRGMLKASYWAVDKSGLKDIKKHYAHVHDKYKEVKE